MANELLGKKGAVKIGANTVASLGNWKLDTSGAELDVTSFGTDLWKDKIIGLKEWSATADGSYVIVTDTNGQTALQTAYLAGTSVTLNLYVDATHHYTGTAYVKKIGIDTSTPEVVKVSFEFTGTGALTQS